MEVASVEKAIPSSNIGYKLLKLMGWKENTGLGRDESGIIEPINPMMNANSSTLGLGKAADDQFYSERAASERKRLESEIEETPELKQFREQKVERKEKITADITEIIKTYYCSLCNKQYKNIGEMQNHLNSYDHHHKKRFQDMKVTEKNRKGNKKKQDKELQRIMQAAAKM